MQASPTTKSPTTRKYKILYVGNFEKNSVGEPEVAKSLRELGHEVTEVQEHFGSCEKVLMEARGGKYDFLLYAKFRVGTPVDVHYLMREIRIPCVCWVFDLYYGL